MHANLRAWAPQVLIALSIWLGWQIISSLVILRGPPEVAVRIAPGSPQALSRAAESEFVAERFDQAEDLAELSLIASAFDVRALRVVGLVRARTDEQSADPLLTLAGNWSLRDDPAHAWLMNRQLRLGNYAGAFGHADTLARRRTELRPTIFRFFTTAATLDSRSLPFLVDRVRVRPNWRADYLEHLRSVPDGPPIEASLAVALNDTSGRLTDPELELLYRNWLADGRLPGLRALRQRLGRPSAGLHDGEFDGRSAPGPFGWLIGTGAGLSASLLDDSSRPDQRALLVETDGFAVNTAAAQLLTLDPGPHVFSAAWKVEAGASDPLMTWTLICLESGQTLMSWTPEKAADWQAHQQAFSAPASGCSFQWLRLMTARGDRRTTIAAWFDQIRIAEGALKIGES